MGFLVVLIPIACCAAIPAVIVVAAFVSSSKRKKLRDNSERLEEVQQGILGEEQAE